MTTAAAAAAKSLQSCPILCDPIDGSPPGSPIPSILQARTLKWVAISFSNAWKWKVKVKSLSCVRLLVTPWTAAHQIPPSMGFSRQEYGVGCHCLLRYSQFNNRGPSSLFSVRSGPGQTVASLPKVNSVEHPWGQSQNWCQGLWLITQSPSFILHPLGFCCCCCKVASVVSNSVRPHRRQPTRLPRPWDSPVFYTGVGWHHLIHFNKCYFSFEGPDLVSCYLLLKPWFKKKQNLINTC